MKVSRDEQSIARTYYQSLRDNFERHGWENDPAKPGYGSTDPHKAKQLAELKQEFDELDPLAGNKVSLGQLFKIEAGLLLLMSEAELRARFWAIENRFSRVVPAGVAKAFAARHHIDNVGTMPESQLRQLARSLLETIQANYQVNFDREILIRRLMICVSIIAVVLIVISGMTAREVVPLAGQRALLLITVVGMAGAIISTIQRLQRATARDAMVDDGIFELTSLRIGWLSVLMSIGIGGVSALFIFALVSAGMLESVVPQLTDGAGALPGPGVLNQQEIALSSAGRCDPEGACPHWADITFQALGLKDRADLFKLIVYAFIAGFAERFVPDTINKLAKEALPPVLPTV